MYNYIIKDYIDSISIKEYKDNTISSKYENIKKIFDNIVSVLYEEDLLTLLVTDNLEIVSIHSDDDENYDYLYNKRLNLELTSSNSFKTYETNNKEVLVYYSSAFYVDSENISYGLIFFGVNHNLEKLINISERLSKSLKNFIDYDKKNFNDYNQLLTSLDSIDDGISSCDGDGRITYINQAACSMLNTTKEEVLNQNLETLIPHSILMKTVKTKKSYLDVEYFIDYKEKVKHLMSSSYPVFDNNHNIIGAVDVYRKIKRSIKVATDLVGYNANYKFNDFIGDSKALSDTIKMAKKFSHSNKNILITGDSGTGKELFAQSIHNYSSRKDDPFVAINCASYPRDLFESELFGYEEGAFTGAKKGGKTGKFELANGGTIFLDEIGEMPLHLQAKLLRIIETKTIIKIGSNKTINVDVRIIAATNRNLEAMVDNNSFREDLYYRLKVLYLHLKPLKDRDNDALILCNHFIEKFSYDLPRNILGLDNDAIEYVKEHDWPGNIRELENIISLSLFYAEGKYITKENLIQAGLKTTNISTDKQSKKTDLATITNEIILETLEKNNGNKKKTAEELGISRNTIYRLLK